MLFVLCPSICFCVHVLHTAPGSSSSSVYSATDIKRISAKVKVKQNFHLYGAATKIPIPHTHCLVEPQDPRVCHPPCARSGAYDFLNATSASFHLSAYHRYPVPNNWMKALSWQFFHRQSVQPSRKLFVRAEAYVSEEYREYLE